MFTLAEVLHLNYYKQIGRADARNLWQKKPFTAPHIFAHAHTHARPRMSLSGVMGGQKRGLHDIEKNSVSTFFPLAWQPNRAYNCVTSTMEKQAWRNILF